MSKTQLKALLAVATLLLVSHGVNAADPLHPATSAAGPTTGQIGEALKVPGGNVPKKAKPKPVANPIDINNASAAQLKKLPMVGDADVAKIIAGRPYFSKAGIAQVLGDGPYSAMKREIIAGPPPKVDVNVADAATLQRLPFITEALAAKIIAGRPYARKDGIAPIVGDRVFSAIKNFVVAGSGTAKR